VAEDTDDFYQSGSSKSEASEMEEDAGQETALLPKSLFQGKSLEPGSKCEIKIESVMGDEVEVSYVPHKDKDDKSDKKSDDSGEAEDAAASIDRGIERMRQM
jgi:hypothetical protein